MKFDPPLEEGVFIRRYKRFFVDIVARDGRELTIHCANTGAMTGCSKPSSRVWYSDSNNSNRKLRYSLELIEDSNNPRQVVCVNTARANQLMQEIIDCTDLPAVIGDELYQREYTTPTLHGRYDFGNQDTIIEVKSVTWKRTSVGVFPDAPSARATKHVNGLRQWLESGKRAILIFCVLHTGVQSVTVAADVDPEFAQAVKAALAVGLEVYALRWQLSRTEYRFDCPIPFQLD